MVNTPFSGSAHEFDHLPDDRALSRWLRDRAHSLACPHRIPKRVRHPPRRRARRRGWRAHREPLASASGYTDPDKYRIHRGRTEVEAESVADIVAGLTGFDTSAYSIGYITGWTGEYTTVIWDTATRVLKAAHTIAEIVDGHD